MKKRYFSYLLLLLLSVGSVAAQDTIYLKCDNAMRYDLSPYATPKYQYTVTADNRNPNVIGEVSGNTFFEFRGPNVTTNPVVNIPLNDERLGTQGTYDISIAVVPENMTDTANHRPKYNYFMAELVCYDDDDNIFVYRGSNGPVQNDPCRVDTLQLFQNVKLPPSVARAELRLTSQVTVRNRNVQSPYMRFDFIALTHHAAAGAAPSNGFEHEALVYDFIDGAEGEVRVVSGDAAQGDVAIPAAVEHDGSTYSVTAIGDYAFCNNDRITSVSVPASVANIGQQPFYGSRNLARISVDEANAAYCTLDGVLYDSGVRRIVTFPTAWSGNYEIPATVDSVRNNTFIGCPQLVGLTVPHTATFLAPRAFNGLTLETLAIDCKNVSTVAGLEQSKHVVLGGNVRSVAAKAYAGNGAVETVTMSDGLESVGDSAFFGCTALRSATLPPTAVRIGTEAFAGSGVEEALLPAALTHVGERAFAECSALTRVAIENVDAATESLPLNLFEGSDAIAAAELNVRSVAPWLAAKPQLVSLTLGDDVERIEAAAFRDCVQLEGVAAGGRLAAVGDEAFKNCRSLETLAFSESLDSIGRRALQGCAALSEIAFPESLGYVGREALDGTAWIDAQADGVVYVQRVAYSIKALSRKTPLWRFARGPRSWARGRLKDKRAYHASTFRAA